MRVPGKKKPEEIDPRQLTEPLLLDSEREEYLRGWSLFNNTEFWHAHEAWENVWKRRSEDSRIFFQGIIQFAAALHLLMDTRRFDGMMRNFDKAEKKLRLFPHHFLGVDVSAVLSSLSQLRDTASRLGPERLRQFDPTLLPRFTVNSEPSTSPTAPHR
jgi:uncharacterized protein